MFRHYLPSIAAFVALVLAMVFVPVGSRLQAGESQILKSSIVSASSSSLCSDTTVGVSLLIEVETRTATEVDVTDGNDSRAITGKDAFGNWWHTSLKAPYDPPLLLTKVNIPCCFGLHRFFLNGAQVLEESWGGSLIRDYTSQPGGGILFDTYQNFTSDGAFMAFAPATYIKYTTEKSVVNKIVNPSDLNTIDAGSIKDLLGSQFNDSGSGSTKTTQKVKITFSGQGKIGVADVNSTTFKDLSNGSISIDSAKDDFNQHLFVCKDAQGNGICDADECATQGPPLCSDGKDNDLDGLIDFPSDKGCSSSDDGDETDPPPPPINRDITFVKQAKPQLIIQPLLQDNEILSFPPPCSTCTVTTTPDHTQFIGGTPLANDGFVIVAKSVDSRDNSISYTVVAVGNYEENNQLFTSDGREYIHLLR